jgi:hypothetical protein
MSGGVTVRFSKKATLPQDYGVSVLAGSKLSGTHVQIGVFTTREPLLCQGLCKPRWIEVIVHQAGKEIVRLKEASFV